MQSHLMLRADHSQLGGACYCLFDARKRDESRVCVYVCIDV